MGRMRRVIAVALAAALLGLGVSLLVGAHVRAVIATAPLAGAPARPRSAAVAPDAGVEPGGDGAGVAATVAPSAAAGNGARSRLAAKQRRGRAGRAPAPAAGDRLLDDLERGIAKLGEHRYQIKSSALALALANLAALGRVVRVAPEMRDGKAFGFRLVRVEPDGAIAKLGLRTGDVLVSINGLDLGTPDQVLDAYGKLEAARQLVLGFVRDGHRLTNEYTIR